MPNLTEVTVPDIGDFKDVPVIEILVKPGDLVVENSPLVMLESDKATIDVPSPRAGTVRSLRIAVGDRVSRGSPLISLETSAPEIIAVSESVAVAEVAAEVRRTESSVAVRHEPAVPINLPINLNERRTLASPSLRRLAREFGFDLRQVSGSGPRGRILKEDLQAFAKAAASAPRRLPDDQDALRVAPWPQLDFSKFGSVERTPLTSIRKISGSNLARNWVMIPHVSNFEDADITELESFRQTLNAEPPSQLKITILAFIMKAVAVTLGKFPQFNASLDGDELILKHYCHIGFAADTPNGLVVPVVRDVRSKGVAQIASETAALALQARSGKLKPADMQGGCFTISSLGGIGGTGFTPIINAPEVAILGATRAQMAPRWNGKEFLPRLILPLSLTWDHRVVDGAAAARFLQHLATLLADFRRIAL